MAQLPPDLPVALGGDEDTPVQNDGTGVQGDVKPPQDPPPPAAQ
jgi:hypothetical protein